MSEKKQKSREEILNKIRSVTRKEQSINDEQGSKVKIKKNKKHKINFSSDTGKFISKLKNANATVSVIDSRSSIIKEVHAYVLKHKVNTTITLANDSGLTSLDWGDADVTTVYEPQSLSVSVTFSWMGVEETGTLVITSSPSCPTGINFLPEHHIVVLDSDNIVERMEDVWQSLRNNNQKIPRTINLITGPSRTADIEYKIEVGAHGPKYLHVILIES